MKKIILPILIAVASVLPMHAQNILVVDVAGVFNNLIEVKAQLQKINGTTESYRTYLNQQGQQLLDLQNKADALQKQADNTANLQDSRDAYRAQFNAAIADVNTKKAAIQSFYTQSQDLLNKSQQALVQTELDKIRAAVQDIALKRKATLVLNASPNLLMVDPVVYSDKASMDITDDVVKELNDAATAAAPAMSAGTATSPAPTMTPTPTMAPAPGMTPPATTN
jgi:outer membrane protein